MACITQFSITGLHQVVVTSSSLKSRKPEYFVVRHANGARDPIMVVEIKRPNTLHTGGKDEARRDIQHYMGGRFRETGLDVMYGLSGVGLWWSVWKMERGSTTMTNVQWRGSVASDFSHRRFERVFDIIDDLM